MLVLPTLLLFAAASGAQAQIVCTPGSTNSTTLNFTAGAGASINVTLQAGTSATVTSTPAVDGSFRYPGGGGALVLSFPGTTTGTIVGPNTGSLIGSSPSSNGTITITCNGGTTTGGTTTNSPTMMVELVNDPGDIQEAIQWVNDLTTGLDPDHEAKKRNCDAISAELARVNGYLSLIKNALEDLNREKHERIVERLWGRSLIREITPERIENMESHLVSVDPEFRSLVQKIKTIQTDQDRLIKLQQSLTAQYEACVRSLGGEGATSFAPIVSPTSSAGFSGRSYTPVTFAGRSGLDAIAALAQAPTSKVVRRGNVTAWLRGNGNAWRDNASTSGKGLGSSGQVGTQVRLSERTTVGTFVGLRHSSARVSSIGQKIKINALGGGMYLSQSFAERFRATVLAFYEHGRNDFTSGTTTADFDSTRLGFAGQFSGTWRHDNWTITPSVGVVWQSVRRDAYTDSAGTATASQTSRTGNLTSGVSFSYGGIRPASEVISAITPYLSVNGAWQFTGQTTFNPVTGVTVNRDNTLTASVATGVNFAFVNQSTLNLGVSYGGVGGDVQTWSVTCGGSVPLAIFGLGGNSGGRLAFAVTQAANGLFGSRLGLQVPLQ